MLRANSRLLLLLDLAWLPGCRAGDDIQAAGSAQARKRAVSAPRLAALVRVGGRPDTSGWPGVRGTVAAARLPDMPVMRGIDLGRGLVKRLARQRRFEPPLS